MLPLGSELWLAYYDQLNNRFVPKCAGTISRIVGDRYFAGGAWHRPGFPHWGSEAEALKWCEGRPEIPAIK